jgi:hypothetical protein
LFAAEAEALGVSAPLAELCLAVLDHLSDYATAHPPEGQQEGAPTEAPALPSFSERSAADPDVVAAARVS